MAQIPETLTYIELVSVEKDGYRAAALVTDLRTDPVEFRCTSPVRPSRLQRLLWGTRLNGYLATYVFGRPLLEALSHRPGVVLTRQKRFMELRPLFNVPFLHVTQTPEDPAYQKIGDNPARGDSSSALPVVHDATFARCHPSFADDFAQAAAALKPLCAAGLLMEPFGRILQAMAYVNAQESGAAFSPSLSNVLNPNLHPEVSGAMVRP